ncbi:hypothetical protein BaRGS_00032369 [Batillaria attramentaria]|uniref:3'-5' exonuclease n=1 Tax=Batillaria attramentaria TaxID=370345 RepID=A0ABD0JNG5_9CAEN
MAPKRRKVKLPDWVGEDYDDRNKLADKDMLAVGEEDKKVPMNSNSKRDTGKEMGSDSCIHATASTSSYSASHKIPKRRCMAGTSTSQVTGDQPLSSSEIIALSMPFLQFSGSLIYSYNSGDCSLLCEDILTTIPVDDYLHVGFDLEWPVTFAAGSTCKVALVQICTVEDKCYLFHIAAMGDFPLALKTLISHQNVIKYGINIEADFWKLERDFDFRVKDVIQKSVKDLSAIANKKLKSSERWTLEGLCRNVLRKRLDKNSSVRCGQWDEYPLSEEQKQYAAADAYASLLLAKRLLKL